MQIFARLSKVNEADRTVEGIIASEDVDLSGEIFDYAKSKPHFQSWSEGIAKATGGKNIGNVRAMHGNVSAGITKQMTFDDDAKQIIVKAEITDDNEWKKVSKGNYTGFSIGGKYGAKWKDPEVKKTRYEAIPSEYSLVDLPCNPSAQFTVVKSDGTEELRKFEHTLGDDEALAKWADGLSDEDAALVLTKIAKRPGVNAKSGEKEYGDVKFADEKNKKYPIDTKAHIRAAWNYINKPHNAGMYSGMDLKSIKNKIVAAWKDKIDPMGPPSARKDKPAKKAAYFDVVASLLVENGAGETIAKAAGELIGKPLEKGLYTVANLAQLLESLHCMAQDTAMESEIEGDHSPIPDELRATVKNLSELLIHMVAEEVEEMNAGDDVEMELAAGDELNKSQEDAMNTELQKSLDDTTAFLEKANTANADLRKALGCEDGDDAIAKAQAMVADLEKARSDHEALTKAHDELKAEHEKANGELAEIRKYAEEIGGKVAATKGAVTAVEKSTAESDLAGAKATDDEPVKKADGTIDPIATAQKQMQKAYQNPQRMLG